MSGPLALAMLLLPQGGWYEGEWVDGERHGSGVRLMRNGSIKVGHLNQPRQTAKHPCLKGLDKAVACWQHTTPCVAVRASACPVWRHLALAVVTQQSSRVNTEG